MLKENQPLSQEKEYCKAKPCNNKESSFRANINIRVYCIHPNNQIETREAGSKAREQGRYYSIKPASSVLHDKGEVTERMRSNRGFEKAENGVRIASISDTGEARYYLTDQVDSVKVVVDKDGATLNKFEYYPYGESWITEGDGNNNPKYNSQELDRETSFYFYNARHYDPEICRFVTADTVVDGNYSASGWNRYMYVDGNPIGYKDPTGHYQINDNFRKNYPKVSERIDTLNKRLDLEKRSAMKKYGFASDKMIDKALKKGSGPKIDVDFLYHRENQEPIISDTPLYDTKTGKDLQYGADAVTSDRARIINSKTGKTEGMKSTINLNAILLNKLEDGEVDMKYLDRVMEHETVHHLFTKYGYKEGIPKGSKKTNWNQYIKSTDKKEDKINMNKIEEGWLYEKEIYQDKKNFIDYLIKKKK